MSSFLRGGKGAKGKSKCISLNGEEKGDGNKKKI